MGFHKRHIDNEQVLRLYEDGGINRIRDWYTKGVDALITETGLASRVGHVISDDDWTQMGTVRQDEEIFQLIREEYGTPVVKK
tara:strand:+ start:817 stop:1065 length:249 start_codon:yes stop_codon:yes gene_type:complete